jgi:MFS family permease
MVGDFFVGSFVLQRALEDSPLRVGLEFLPVAVGVGVGAQLGGRLLRRFSARMVAPVALGLAAVGEGAAAFSGGHRILLLAGLSVASFGIGAVFVTAFNAALATADPAEGGVRSAVVSTAHELGGAFGVAVLSTVAGTALIAVAPRVADFSVAFLVAAAAAAGGAVVAALLAPGSRRAAGPTGHPTGEATGHLAGHAGH